ncbi:MAG: hypothetical protein WDA00_01130 [Eubacteriales bacterium]
MKMSTPHDTPTHLLKNPEQYITRVGKCLRKTSPDELPQMRDTTERPEGIEAGTLTLVDTDEKAIYASFAPLLYNKAEIIKWQMQEILTAMGLLAKE